MSKRVSSIDWSRWSTVLAGGLILFGMLARIMPIARNRFHQDEAIYGYWALQIATGKNPWLSGLPVDKPPLFIYWLALFLALFGPSEAAARLPSELASLASLVLLYLLADRIYGRMTALTALGLMGLSPFNISFAPTAFTDPTMSALVLGALLAAAYRRIGLAGLLLGLAFITKPTAALFAPLTVAIYGFTQPARDCHSAEETACRSRDVLSFFAGLAAVVGPAFAWDAWRRASHGFIEQSILSYGGLRLVPPDRWMERVESWRSLLTYLTGATILDVLLTAGIPVLILNAVLWRLRKYSLRIDLCLLLFSAFFLIVHIVIDFNVWDRYLLPLVPCLLLLLARTLTLPAAQGAQAVRGRAQFFMKSGHWVALLVLLILTAVRPAQDAAAGRLPIGGDHGAYEGFDALMNYYRGHIPGGAIVYHHWLGWHYFFYLYNFPYQFQFYRDPGELAQHAAAHRGVPRFVAFPSWHSSTQLLWTLKHFGMIAQPIYETYREDGSRSFTLFKIKEAAP